MVIMEVKAMIAVWLILSSLMYSLRLNTRSFPRPLTQEEQRYLALAQKGNVEARNVLIEHNLRLVAHMRRETFCGGQTEGFCLRII